MCFHNRTLFSGNNHIYFNNKHGLGLPDNKTRSLRSSPLLPNKVWRVEKLLVGAGIWANASEEFEISPSLLPVGTLQVGPPYSFPKTKKKIKLIFEQ